MNLAIRILLSIFAIMLVIAAVVMLLKGFGILPPIPEHVLWALLLLAVGVGIMGGLKGA